MKIKSLHLENFMLFDSLDIEWSPNVNVISGGNSTGKTTLLKALYSIVKSQSECDNNPRRSNSAKNALVHKLLGCFRPDGMKIGRLVTRQRGNTAAASLVVNTYSGSSIRVSFSNRQDRRLSLSKDNFVESFADAVYIPPKEMISATEYFQSLYEDYHIDFEEMYYDLTKLLSRPLKKGPNSVQQKNIMKNFMKSFMKNSRGESSENIPNENIPKWKITQKDKKFYLQLSGEGNFEMGLLSEGYRKLATIIYLIQSGSLNASSILFWDEPETNMNPAMIHPLADAIMRLAEMGVQVFISTHDYFVQQAFNMYNVYPRLKQKESEIKFISLYSKAEGITYEAGATVSDLEHNPIMEEFNNLYDRELGYLDGDN